ncbi:MAG: glycoside hydrolase family 3 N-terminal domain-containing protein [Phycisphaeraceae bacterium]
MPTEEVPAWRDPELDTPARVEDLLGRLTLEEKVDLLDTRGAGAERLGLPKFQYGGEALHGLCNTGRATSFPMPIAMAATFDPGLIEKIGGATADEMRAKYHAPEWQDSMRVSLLVYSPVINILRDPRWGRAQETFGEDPVLTSEMGKAFVRGLQGDHPKYVKLAACAKHLGVASGPEALRMKFNAVVSRKDMMETYLYAFGELVKGGVATVMATYNRVNGEHCCAHPFMIGEYLRKQHQFDGVVMSDGGALNSLHRIEGEPDRHNLTEDIVETAALCLKRGCDFELGTKAYKHVPEAIERGLISEDDVDHALRRVLRLRFDTGECDPPEQVPFTRTKLDVIQCPEHLALARESAARSLVLLENENDALPLREDRDRTVLVCGPGSVDLQILLGNFYKGASGSLRSILEGVTSAAPEGVTITHSQGCFYAHPNAFESTWTFGLAEWADAVVACVGYSPLMESEQGEAIGAPDGGDRSTIAMPEHQLRFLREMRRHIDEKRPHAKLITVVTGGSPIELEEVRNLSDAVLMAWYPGEQGGDAVGDVIWGRQAPSGKLPVTFPKRLADLPDYENYDMQGRTYRYLDKEPLYPFGYGLSYTSFEIGEPRVSAGPIAEGDVLEVEADVTNTGPRGGEEVVQLYLEYPEHLPERPHRALRAFARVKLEPGETRRVTFALPAEKLRFFHPAEERWMLCPGAYAVAVGRSSADVVRTTFQVQGEPAGQA